MKEVPKRKDQNDIEINVGGEEEDKKEEGEAEEAEVDDGAKLALDCEELLERLDKIAQMAQAKKEHQEFIEEIRRLNISFGLTPDYKYYILMCGLFNIARTPLKNFKKHEKLFKHYTEKEELGKKHFLQAIVYFFIRRFPDLQKEAASLMQYLVMNKFFAKDFLLQWNAKKLKMDKSSILYDRKAEKKMKGLLESFMGWLEDLDSDSSSSEESSDEGEEEKKEEVKKEETEEEKRKREQAELIKKQ